MKGSFGRLFGRNCLVCNEPSDDVLCPDCKAILDAECFDSYMVRCPKCFFPMVSYDYDCPRCHTKEGKSCTNTSVVPIYAIADYNSNLSYSLLHRFKFFGDKKMAKVAAMYMQRAVDALDPKGDAYIVPVPCSRRSLKERGWDQMVQVCRYMDRPMLRILENTNEELSQQKLLDRNQRMEKGRERRFSVISAYEKMAYEEIEDKYTRRPVVLVDDVTTTFSTIQAAAGCLAGMGFKDVKAAVWLYDYKA